MGMYLYIIGNGFDLHHGINSKYTDFRNWLDQTNCDLLCRVEDIYGCCDSDWWGNFEKQLASLDAICFSADIAFEHEPDLASEHCDSTWDEAEREVEMHLNSLFSELRECFREWILQLNRPSFYNKIILRKHDAIFINFNYTTTLEDLYGIDPFKILHIHGCIKCEEEFILGHGKSYEELQDLNRIKRPITSSVLDDDLDQIHYYGSEFHERLALSAAIRGVASQRKPVQEIIQKNRFFFKSLKDIDLIYVYGMSLSEIDRPYLSFFANRFKEVTWEFSAFNNDDRTNIESFCENNRVQNYRIINLNDILVTMIR